MSSNSSLSEFLCFVQILISALSLASLLPFLYYEYSCAMKIVKYFFALILLLALFPLFSRQTLAKCVSGLSLSEYRKQADIVISGTVNVVRDKDFFVVSDMYYKGRGPETVRIIGSMSDADISTIDFLPDQGKRYLLFLKFTDSDGLRTNVCMGNRMIEQGLSVADKTALGTSKLTPTPTPPGAFHNEYRFSTPAITIMVLSGGIIFWLLSMSFSWKGHKRKKKG
jgi:hypothetical protein